MHDVQCSVYIRSGKCNIAKKSVTKPAFARFPGLHGEILNWSRWDSLSIPQLVIRALCSAMPVNYIHVHVAVHYTISHVNAYW